MKKLILTILLTVSISSFSQEAVRVEKGDSAPFTGILVTDSKITELDKAQRKSIVLEDLRIRQEELIDYYRTDARVQRNKLTSAKFDSNLKAIGYFVLGSLMTAFAFKVAEKTGDI